MSDTIPPYPAYEEPPEYDAGLEFNYDRWVPGTTVTLTNVPWDSNYRDVVAFNSHDRLNAYIDAKTNANTVITELSWAKPGMPLKLPMTINAVNKFNYIRVLNPAQADSGINGDPIQYYYYFVTGAEWGSPNSTIVTVQLDIWATYHPYITLGRCFIEQGHVGIANELQYSNHGRDYLSVPEGLDVGGDYQIMARRHRNVMYTAVEDNPDRPELDGYAVLMVSTVDLTVDPGGINDPQIKTARGDRFQGLPSGAEYYVFADVADFLNFQNRWTEVPWVTQSIVSITAIPKPARYGYTLEQVDMSQHTTEILRTTKLYKMSGMFGQGAQWKLWPNWRQEFFATYIPYRYRHLWKFMMAPYLMLEMTTFSGTPVMLKPESWNDEDLTINEKASLVPPNQRIMFIPQGYNARNGAALEGPRRNGVLDVRDDGGEYLDMATQIANFPTFAMVNNAALGVLASSANSRAYEYRMADWSQTRAAATAANTLTQGRNAVKGVEAQGDISRGADLQQTNIGQDALVASTMVNSVGSLGGSITGGPTAIAGSALSVTAGLVNAGIQYNATALAQGVRNQTSLDSQDVVVSQMRFNNDSNWSLAQRVQQGDYAAAIGGINARVQDAYLTPPSTSGQTGGEAFNMIHGASRVSVRFKSLHPAAMAMVGDMWLRYGYKIMRFGVITNTIVMSKFTYWRVAESYAQGNAPEIVKQMFRGIFEKGVTVWVNADDIGNIDIADNEPLPGVRL